MFKRFVPKGWIFVKTNIIWCLSRIFTWGRGRFCLVSFLAWNECIMDSGRWKASSVVIWCLRGAGDGVVWSLFCFCLVSSVQLCWGKSVVLMLEERKSKERWANKKCALAQLVVPWCCQRLKAGSNPACICKCPSASRLHIVCFNNQVHFVNANIILKHHMYVWTAHVLLCFTFSRAPKILTVNPALGSNFLNMQIICAYLCMFIIFARLC